MKKIKYILTILTVLISLQSKAQNYVPQYLLNASDFLQNNFYVHDSSGWFSTYPDSLVSFTSFIQNHKADF